MEYSIQPISAALPSIGAAASAPRALGITAGVARTAPVEPISVAVMTRVVPMGTAPAAQASGLTGMIDRIRSDFDAYRGRIATGFQPKTGGSSTADLTGMINHALRAQVEIFDTSIVFHAGLTVSQHSQNGVKTLIEKG